MSSTDGERPARDDWYDYFAPARPPLPPNGTALPPRDPPPGGAARPARWARRARAATTLVAAGTILLTGWRLGLLPRPGTTADSPAGSALAGRLLGDTGPRLAGSGEVPPMRAVTTPARLLPAVTPPSGPDSYRLLIPPAAGTAPATWDPCQPVRYVVRPAGAPPDGAALLIRAFAALSAATGLSFVDDGTTDEVPGDNRPAYQPERYGKRWAPVLVVWSDAGESPSLGGTVAGRAGPVAVTIGGQPPRLVSGQVALDAPDLLAARARPGGSALGYDVVLHELGHLVGLGHVDDDTQLMSPRGSRVPLTGYAVGDLRGLALLGAGRCSTRAPG